MDTLQIPHGSAIDADRLAAELASLCEGAVSVAQRDGVVTVQADRIIDTNAASQAIDAHEAESTRQLRQLEAKARRVWAGDETFTAAQIQRLVAGLVLREIERQ